jgi:hypothetical protein
MSRYLPIAFGVLLMVGLTYVQFRMTDRLGGSNITAADRAQLLKKIPDKIGDWHGTDMPIDEQVRQTSGAEGAVQRKYRNVRTGEMVDLWLIVGHGRSVSRHTPNVCYPNNGFAARNVQSSLYPLVLEDESESMFFTNTFSSEGAKGRQLIRVFWTWYNAADHDGKVVWEAPSNPTWYFGNTRALFKMYFTSAMRDVAETAEKSSCLNFAREFLPVVNSALAQVTNPNAAPAVAEPDASKADDAAPETVAKTDEQAPSEAATEQATETPAAPTETSAAPTEAPAVPATSEGAPSAK